MFSGLLSCFPPCHLVTCYLFSVPQLHLITNHLPTVFSFQVPSQSLQNPHSIFHATVTIFKPGFATIITIAIVLLNHSLVS